MSNIRDIHERVLQAKNPDDLAAAYADWAGNYDADLVGEMGYQAPHAAVELLHASLASPGALILDAGCGTGLVGEELSRLGYKRLVGLDYSSDMLQHARTKNVYDKLLELEPGMVATDSHYLELLLTQSNLHARMPL